MVRTLLAALSLSLAGPALAAPSPAELANGVVSALRDAEGLRYDVIASDHPDLRDANHVVRATVLAELGPEQTVKAYRIDARMTGEGIPRGARLVLTASEEGAQFLEYAGKTEARLAFEDIESHDGAQTLARLVEWVDLFMPGEDRLPFLDDPSAPVSVRGPERVGRDECDVIEARLPTSELDVFISRATGLPVRFDARYDNAEPVTMLLNNLRADARIAPGQFAIRPAPRGFTDAPVAGAGKNRPAASGRAAATRAPDADASVGLELGDLAPDFTLRDPRGRSRSLSEYRGKVVLVDFWGVWCHWCKVAMPGLQRMHRELGSKGLVVLGVNVGDPSHDVPIEYMRSHGITYTLLLDGRPVADSYQVTGFPTFYLVGKNGQIIFKGSGYSAEQEFAMENVIRVELGMPERDLTVDDLDNLDDADFDDFDG